MTKPTTEATRHMEALNLHHALVELINTAIARMRNSELPDRQIVDILLNALRFTSLDVFRSSFGDSEFVVQSLRFLTHLANGVEEIEKASREVGVRH